MEALLFLSSGLRIPPEEWCWHGGKDLLENPLWQEDMPVLAHHLGGRAGAGPLLTVPLRRPAQASHRAPCHCGGGGAGEEGLG